MYRYVYYSRQEGFFRLSQFRLTEKEIYTDNWKVEGAIYAQGSKRFIMQDGKLLRYDNI
jgi:hypothetical protein